MTPVWFVLRPIGAKSHRGVRRSPFTPPDHPQVALDSKIESLSTSGPTNVDRGGDRGFAGWSARTVAAQTVAGGGGALTWGVTGRVTRSRGRWRFVVCAQGE